MVIGETPEWGPIVQRWHTLDGVVGAEFWVVRDDLLPFPLPGNKVRKIQAELQQLDSDVDVLITNGGVNSNHCRTLAMFAAQMGRHAHLVLHGVEDDKGCQSLNMLSALGATFDIGPSSTISNRIQDASAKFSREGKNTYILSGGGHTPKGAIAYRDAGMEVFRKSTFDQVFVASGTGATQGGLVAAAELSGSAAEVIGVSVARSAVRGVAPVSEAARWAGAESPTVRFLDSYIAGGYGSADQRVKDAVQIGWRHGLPLDLTYTGKAFSAILDLSKQKLLGSSILFWHTGGLWNWLSSRD